MDNVTFSAFTNELAKIAGPVTDKAVTFVKKHKMLLGGLGVGTYAGYKLRGARDRAKQLYAINQQMGMR